MSISLSTGAATSVTASVAVAVAVAMLLISSVEGWELGGSRVEREQEQGSRYRTIDLVLYLLNNGST